MEITEFLTALFLGFVEGLTEFIPVSSTAHLILLTEGMNFPAPPGHVFEVFIQIGAIFAVVLLYRRKLWQTLMGLTGDPVAQRFTVNLIVGTIPAVILGGLGHGWIKSHLYNPQVIAVTLFVGGVLILILEKRFNKPRIFEVDGVTPKLAFLIGCFQTIALIPGVSRSGATIMGSLALGLSRTAAAEFSFFLAIPVMFGAVAYDLYKNWAALMSYPHLELMMVGLLASLLTALVVLKAALRLIKGYGFASFAWYRIVLSACVVYIFIW